MLIERISWWVAIVGFPVAIAGVFLSFWQLILVRRDQTRIAEQLSRRPDLQVGFEIPLQAAPRNLADDEPLEITVAKPTLIDNLEAATTVQPDGWALADVKVKTYNAGDLVARNLLWNYALLPIGAEAVTTGTKWIARRDAEGPFRLITTADHLQPDVVEPHSMRLRVAQGVSKVFIHYSIQSDEVRGKRGILTVLLT
jgi:hypothetical protein